jgi:hypothetical protein
VNSPADNCPGESCQSAAAGEGAATVIFAKDSSAAALDILDPEIYQDQLLCAKCGGTKLHFEIFRFENGWMISCQGCGDERVVRKLPFSSISKS